MEKIGEEERTADNANKTELTIFEAKEMKVFIDKTDYLFPDFMPLRKGEFNTVSGATLEFLIYLTLLMSKKINAVFLSNYDLDSLFPHFANVAKRMPQKDRVNIKDIKAGNLTAEIDEANIIISTAYIDKKGFTVICPQSENRLPDFYFKNGDVYSKFWNKIFRVENLRGNGEIRLSVMETEKKENKSLFDSIFKKNK